MNQDLFGQVALYIGGFGISDNIVSRLGFTFEQKILFYLGFLLLSYILLTTKV